ncbi:MAG: IS30 family transposase [Nitrospira sp.]|nr:IS30 family transposase [Nitrospira sp.]
MSSDHLRRSLSALRLAKAGKTQAEIGQALRFSQGTVSKELARSTGGRGYRFQQAQHTAQAGQQQIRHQPRKLTSRVRRAIARKLRAERWSQEQINFWLRAERCLYVSHEWIYQMIWTNKRTGGDLWRFLRRRGRCYNRRGAHTAGRGVIPYRIDIAERSAIVAAKSRPGDWERDTIVSARHQGGLLTHVERRSLFTTISKLSRPTAQATHRVTVHRLTRLSNHVHTITYDNGKEFAGHRKTAQCLQAHVFFATPYHAWESGVNENTNRLIRDFFPKGTDFTRTHPATVARMERLLNRRPRKSLGFQTPNEVFRALAKRS